MFEPRLLKVVNQIDIFDFFWMLWAIQYLVDSRIVHEKI